MRTKRSAAAGKNQDILKEESKIAELFGERDQIEQQIKDYYTNRRQVIKQIGKNAAAIKKMEKSAGVSHASVIGAITENEKADAKLQSKYNKISGKLRKTKSKMQKEGERFGSLITQNQESSKRRGEIAAEFEDATKQLTDVEKKIGDFNAEIRTIEGNRAKAEQEIDGLIAELERLEKRRGEEEAAYWKLSENRDIEKELKALDQRRQTAGGPLQTLEQQRKKLLERLKNRALEIDDAWDDLQYVDKEWDKQVAKLGKKRSKIKDLEDQRGQVQVKIDKLVDEREQTRTKIASILKERSKLNSIASKAEQRIAAAAASLSGASPVWKQQTEQRNQAIVGLRKGNSLWSDKVDQLKTARIASAAKFQGDQVGAYKSLRDEFDSATKQRISLDEQAFDLFEKLMVTDKELLSRVQAIAKIQAERTELAKQWQASEAKQAKLQSVWSESDRNAGSSLRKRKQLELNRDKLESQQQKLEQQRQRLLTQRSELIQKENEIRAEVIERDKERRLSITRDLLNNDSAPASKKTSARKRK